MDVSKLFDVKGKVVLVTGGAKGVGRMISEGYVANGAKVYISSRDAAACDRAAAELNGRGPGTAVALPANLQSLAACEALAAELGRREGRLHVLVNNSGATWGESFDTFPDAAWTKLLTLNLHRVFTLTQLLTPLLEAAAVSAPLLSSGSGSGSGGDAEGDGGTKTWLDPARIINIGSIDGLRVPLMSSYAYSASKAGLHHLSRHLAVELGRRGITSNTLACGPFPSKMMKAVLDAAGEQIRESSPLGRIGGAEDVAGACLWLSGRAGAFVNGATIALDGGISLLAKI